MPNAKSPTDAQSRAMSNTRRFRRVLDFESVDRLPMIEWAGWWHLTLQRWYDEGLSRRVRMVREHLGLDDLRQFWLGARGPGCPGAPSHGAPIIKSHEDYERIRPFLYPDQALDKSPGLLALSKRQARGRSVVWMTLDGYFWFPRTLLGIEGHFYALYEKPDLIARINTDLLEHNLRVVEQFCGACTPVFMTIAEDMSFNHGTMCSKAIFDELIGPYYRPLTEALRRRGVHVFVDSDGDVTELIPWLEEVGVEGILPLERMAGVDVAEIRRNHPKWLMIGGFDKTVMKHGEEAMRREFERLLPTMRSGGFVPSVDHQTPPDVSLETYRVYVGLLEEYCRKATE